MARTRAVGMRECPRDPDEEARIQGAVHDALYGVFYTSFRRAAIAHKTGTITNSDSAAPLHHRELRAQLFEIVNVYPGKSWVRRFISRHVDITVAKSRGLGPKCAQNFNQSTITGYFDMRKALDDKHGEIPLERTWNVDGKWCQMGGGRKGDNSKFIFSKSNRKPYRIQ
ncbi:hypothetical protein BDR04DRAFT_1185163 [Suillus decipiens]|nr:hypothetical protein BDR04DRAFT_1185163 [Suillus decipiens]